MKKKRLLAEALVVRPCCFCSSFFLVAVSQLLYTRDTVDEKYQESRWSCHHKHLKTREKREELFVNRNVCVYHSFKYTQKNDATKGLKIKIQLSLLNWRQQKVATTSPLSVGERKFRRWLIVLTFRKDQKKKGIKEFVSKTLVHLSVGILQLQNGTIYLCFHIVFLFFSN